MALMDRVQRLNAECITQVCSFYEGKMFPVALRSLYAKEIEQAVCGSDFIVLDSSSPLGGWNPSDPFHREPITQFIRQLVDHLANRLSGQDEPIPLEVRPQLSLAFPDIQTLCQTDPLRLFTIIRDSIQFEIALVQSQEVGAVSRDIIMDTLTHLKRSVLGVTETLGKLDAEQKMFELHLTESTNLEDYSQSQTLTNEQSARRQELQTIIQANITNLQHLQMEFKVKCQQNLLELGKLQSLIISEKIRTWKFQQQRQMNGTPIPEMDRVSLERLQAWCEELAGLTWTMYQRLNEFMQIKDKNLVLTDDVSDLKDDIVRLLTELLNQSFLVESQPPQVMKKGTRFPTALTVSLLVGHKLSVQMTPPQVRTCIITESQAKGLPVADAIKPAGEIVNGSSLFEFSSDLRRLVAHFRSIQLKRIERAEKRTGAGNECVMEEKFCLLFESIVSVGDLKIRIQALSLPVVVTSHGSQEAQAVATIMWDNAFAEPDRVPFKVPNSVTWAQLSQVISNKFEQVTGRGLSEDQLGFLRQKAFRNRSHSDCITWSEFCKDHLPDKSFTFWDWVHGALRVLEKKETNLKELWKEGLITGFIERQQAERLLALCPAGNFLLRFSDSFLGAITIVWVNKSGVVHHIHPFGPTELIANRLADRVKELQALTHLYPDLPKNAMFEKFYTPPKKQPPQSRNPSGHPYEQLVLTLPNSEHEGSNPNTPPSAGTPTLGPVWPPTMSPSGSERSRGGSLDYSQSGFDTDYAMDDASSQSLQPNSPMIPAFDQLRASSPYSSAPRSPLSPSNGSTSTFHNLSPQLDVIHTAFEMANAGESMNQFDAQFQEIEGILNLPPSTTSSHFLTSL